MALQLIHIGKHILALAPKVMYFWSLVGLIRFLIQGCGVIIPVLAGFAQNSAPAGTEGWQFTPPALRPSVKPLTYVPAAAPDEPFPPLEHSTSTASTTSAEVRSFTTAEIGYTYFDIQTNASILRSLYKNETDNRLFAVWNYVPELDPNLSQRGTGYNYFANSTWQPAPSTRLETSKTGWPNYVMLHDLESEFILTHNLNFATTQTTSRSPVITGSWVEQLTPLAAPPGFSYGVWWPRIVRGDNSFGNKYLHALALTLPVQNGGARYQNIDGALLYYRSKDNGKTWDKQYVLLAAIDSNQFARIRPDCYAIDAYQNNIAIVVGGYGNDLVLILSPDNGLSWNKYIVQNFPIDRFDDQITDINGDGWADWIDTNDGSLAVLIDKGGIVHVWAGYAQILNDNSGDRTFSFNPYANGILYWNTTMSNSPMRLITGAIDLDGNDTLDIGPLGFFNSGLASHPSAGTDANGNLWLAYSAVNELGRDSDGKNVRHTYLIGSTYGGQVWSAPYSVVAELNSECIYASVARTNDANVRLIYQKDYCAGVSLTYGFPDPCNSGKLNTIVYVEAPASKINTGLTSLTPQPHATIYPNPCSETCFMNIETLTQPAVLTVSTLWGQPVIRDQLVHAPVVQLSVFDLPPALYVVTLTAPDYRQRWLMTVVR